jgi:hypothetical protein
MLPGIPDFDPDDLQLVCEQYEAASIDHIQEMVALGADKEKIVRRCDYLAGCMDGLLQSNKVPYAIVQLCVATFMAALDRHIIECTPIENHQPSCSISMTLQ